MKTIGPPTGVALGRLLILSQTAWSASAGSKEAEWVEAAE